MLIAIAQEGTRVCEHFGHCECFSLYETEDKTWKFIDNPGHQPGFLPGFLHDQGVQVVIAGGMGARAQELFASQGIKVLVGVSGPVNEAVNLYEKGSLTSSGEICNQHMHAGDCHSE